MFTPLDRRCGPIHTDVYGGYYRAGADHDAIAHQAERWHAGSAERASAARELAARR